MAGSRRGEHDQRDSPGQRGLSEARRTPWLRRRTEGCPSRNSRSSTTPGTSPPSRNSSRQRPDKASRGATRRSESLPRPGSPRRRGARLDAGDQPPRCRCPAHRQGPPGQAGGVRLQGQVVDNAEWRRVGPHGRDRQPGRCAHAGARHRPHHGPLQASTKRSHRRPRLRRGRGRRRPRCPRREARGHPRRGKPSVARQRVQRGRTFTKARARRRSSPISSATTDGSVYASTASAAPERGSGGVCSPTTSPRSVSYSKTPAPSPLPSSRQRPDARPTGEPAHRENAPMHPPPEPRSRSRFRHVPTVQQRTERAAGTGARERERAADASAKLKSGQIGCPSRLQEEVASYFLVKNRDGQARETP